MIDFVLAAAALGALTALAVVFPLWRGSQREASRAARDAAIFRDQLDELERDRARGLISEAEAAGTRAEISRRLIAATQRAERSGGFGAAPRARSRSLAAAGLLAVPLLGAAVYLSTGAPGYRDTPFAERTAAERRAGVAELPGQRMGQAEAEAAARAEGRLPKPEIRGGADPRAAEVAALAAEVAGDPEAVEARGHLAQAYMQRGRFAEAAALYGEMIRLLAPRVEGGLFTARAEALVLAAGGYVSPEAETALRRALRVDARDPVARYYAGLAIAQQGNALQAVAIWEELEAEARPDDPWLPLVEAVLAQARAAGYGGRPRDPAVAAVQEMSPEERAAFMAERMASLEARLTDEGGTVEDWVMLIRSYQRSGRQEDARRAYALSQRALRGSEASAVREQALLMGVISE